jgi:hypothetical protein
MLALLLATILLPAQAAPALALDCRAAPLKDHAYWQWREIGGRRCWYVGQKKLAKTLLHWNAKPLSRSSRSGAGGGEVRRTPAPVVVPAPPLTFDARWNAMWQQGANQ